MAANTWSTLAPVNFTPMVQDYLESYLVATQISNTKWNSLLKSGQSIDFPTTTDMRSQVYTPGTDLTIDLNTSASDTMLINQSRAVTWTMDPNQRAQAEDKGIAAKLAQRAAYITAKQIDQNVLSTAITGAQGSVTGGTLSTSSIYTKLTDALATLQRNEGADGPLFAVLDPERVALLAQNQVANGFNVADNALKNGFVGDSVTGFKVYSSNNLPSSLTLTMPTIPTANDTFTLLGITFTWKAAAGATTAGDISIGNNVGESQDNFLLMIAGTATGSAATYIDVSVANRRKMQNAVLAATAFAVNVSTITAFGKVAATEVVTPADFAFGTETSSLLTGRIGAPSLAMQINPTMAEAPLPNRPMETNYALHTLYGRKVFARDAFKLCKITFNV